MTDFLWSCHPQAEKWLFAAIEKMVESHRQLNDLRMIFYERASIHLFQLCDHLAFPFSQDYASALINFGFSLVEEGESGFLYRHTEADLPFVWLERDLSSSMRFGLAVDSIELFLAWHRIKSEVKVPSYGPLRFAPLSKEGEFQLTLVERKGSASMITHPLPLNYGSYYEEARALWWGRSRRGEEVALFEEAFKIAEKMVDLVGKDVTAFLILDHERMYWEKRSKAALFQRSRQDSVGIGWANRDHHTFRSSRRHFHRLIRLFTKVGFFPRERFYAGKEAGWGAQVMESQGCDSVLFLDVDLSEEELSVDFLNQPLADQRDLGTIGLWCALHGESILQAGMHHLEGQFAFDKLKEDFAQSGVAMMDPFSDFPYLKQAFTAPEIWPVAPNRVEELYRDGKISLEMKERFLEQGAIGSHLENLERRGGYKGFNQKNVSHIIQKTDPRGV